MKKIPKISLFGFFLCFSVSLLAQEFVNTLPIPPIIPSTDSNYHLNVIETQHNFNPSGTDTLNTLVTTFAFEDAKNPGTTTILGPSIAWQYGTMLSPQVTNTLTERTTTHWHGAHVPQPADGGPHSIILPGETWFPIFEVLDKSATMWYHPHAMDLTYRHVQMGLSGMIYVEDPLEGDVILSALHELLPTEYGIVDFPLIFQTKKFERDSVGNIAIQAEQGYKNGYVYLVNGVMDPSAIFPADMVRIRILNGDGKFSYNFRVNYSDGSIFPAQMIATDAGYMDRSYQLDDILMAPGERTEWLLDLRGLEGDTLYIRNLVSDIPSSVIGDSSTTKGYAEDRDLLQIIIGPSSGIESSITSFPIPLHPLEAPSMSEVSNTRIKTFRKDSFLIDGKYQYLFNIDSTLMDMMVVNDVVKMDSTEIWTINNTTDVAHPWHIHDIHFYVTEVIDNGSPLNPDDYPEIFKGPKDNVLVMPGWELSYITTFSDFGTEIAFDSSYMYHCHILPHEDRGMMGQFVVWNGQGDPPVNVEDPELSDRPMKVYPNPVRKQLYIEGESRARSTLRIFDLQGRKLSQVSLPPFDGSIGLNISDLPKGTVILEWLTKEGIAVSKVVIN